MKSKIKVLASYGLWLQAISAFELAPEPYVTIVNSINLAVRQEIPGVKIAAIVPTQSGQIGINPPGIEPTPANIEGHTKYLSLEGTTTKWIGVDPVNIEVKTTVTTKKGGETAPATITKGVSAVKNAAGGLDILLSPAVKSKLEEIAKLVKPCAPLRRRGPRNRKLKRQGGEACGLADFVQRVGADPELQGNFAEPLTDQAWHEIDEGYESDPGQDGGWEGDGGEHVPGEDEGYFSDDGEGFFEGAGGPEGESTVETIVFATEEEAAAIGAALSGGEAAAAAAVWGGSTVTAGSFLAWLWGSLKDGKPIPNANSIPKESIHKITKTKTKTDSSTTTTSSSSCPTGPAPQCGSNCAPTSTQVDVPNATGVVMWRCSKGDRKDCACDPEVVDIIEIYDVNFHQAVLEAIGEIDVTPKEASIECPGGISSVPSKFLLDMTAKGFCEEVMANLDSNNGPSAYDIYGNKIPLLRQAKLASAVAKRQLGKRNPPENPDNYNDFKVFLGYTKEDGKCRVPKEDLCRSAYDKLVSSNCGTNQGLAGDRMFTDASIDVGCGKFTWHVEKPAELLPAPSLSGRSCHHRHRHDDVHNDVQDAWAGIGCDAFAKGKTMKAGDKEIGWHPVGFVDLNAKFKISWIEGCSTSAAEQSTEFPIEADHGITCYSLLRSNYVDCNNGGAGGSIDAGCLRYDFYI